MDQNVTKTQQTARDCGPCQCGPTKNYTVIVDEICSEHGGRNFSYQYDDENFVRIDSLCEGCQTVSRHVVSQQLQAARNARQPQVRPHRPSRN